MPGYCRKYKSSIKSIRASEPCYLRSFFDKLMPGPRFCFITLENNDYRKRCLTFLFWSEMPPTVTICVEHPSDIHPAIRYIMHLNNRIHWEAVQFIYPPDGDAVNGQIMIEVQLPGNSMHINSSGLLIS